MGQADYFVLFFLVIYGAVILISLAMAVLQLIAYWKLFEKAGEPGWAAIVPVYNFLVMFRIATGKTTLGWVYLILIGIYVFLIFVISFLLAIVQSTLMTELLSLGFLGVVIVFCLAQYGLLGYNSYMLTKAYGKDTLLCILSIFFRSIIVLVLGLDKNTVYTGPLRNNSP